MPRFPTRKPAEEAQLPQNHYGSGRNIHALAKTFIATKQCNRNFFLETFARPELRENNECNHVMKFSFLYLISTYDRLQIQ